MSVRAISTAEAATIVRKLRSAQCGDEAVEGAMRKDHHVARRSYGSGSLLVRRHAWYGQWRVGGRLVRRKLGPMRDPGSRRGLTKSQAEAALRQAMSEVVASSPTERIGVDEAGSRYVRHLETVRQRKPSTIQDYEIMLRRHFVPYFGDQPLDRIDSGAIESYVQTKLRAGLARQTVLNQLNFLSGIFGHSVRRGWARENVVTNVERPPAGRSDPDIRFLRSEEVEALLRAVPSDALGEMERVLYLVAAMTGLRQGELVALRWKDVDWGARVVRVRQSFSRGQFGPPKSRRSSRAVPMADRVAAQLELQFQRAAFQADSDLVFCHPQTGRPYDASRLRKRFRTAIAAAGVRDVRFHDLRHTFGTQMAASGAPLRSLMEWMGHRDFATTLVYADYAPDPAQGAALVERAFGADINSDINLTGSEPVEHDPRGL